MWFLLGVALAANQKFTCPCGYYCPLPQPHTFKTPVPCPVGSFCRQGEYKQRSSPTQCVAGSHCPTSGLCMPMECPCGSYCPAGASRPIRCPVGAYCPANSTKPVKCTAQQDCFSPSLCLPVPAAAMTASVCDPGCDPMDPPRGYFCSIDPSVGCGLFCYDALICKVEEDSLLTAD